MFTYKRSTLAMVLTALLLLLGVAWVHAAIGLTDKISDVRGTKHNLSAGTTATTYVRNGQTFNFPARTVTSASETQVCVFCHTPHGATSNIEAPLWNRALSSATYPNVLNPTYSSSSIEASATEIAAGPGGSSKLCLSCHDGTMAIDKVNVLNGLANATPEMVGLTGTLGSRKLSVTTATTGFTRNLGTNLNNDHPISFTYNTALATADGELRPVDGTSAAAPVGNRVAGAAKPKMPLEDNQMQCATCHDPHLRDKNTGNGNAKFLRMNRFQRLQPTGGDFVEDRDIICLACHNKGGTSWAYSAHANSAVAAQLYKAGAAQTREFPSSLDAPANTNPPVWQVSCLNCHDTHTVQGARRLLREGTDSTTTPKAGGNAAMEETCYQCHNGSANSIVTFTANTVTAVPDIKTDFTTGNVRMPITSVAQAAGTEVHEIGGIFNNGTNANCDNTTGLGNCGKDLLESRFKLGFGGVDALGLNNRHAECSDCHNPHRVIKYKDGLPGDLAALTFNNTGMSASGTHKHTDDGTDIHTNNISGVLRGSWGVEPIYNSNSFQITPSTGITFAVKRGDPGTNPAPAPTVDTRELPLGGNKTYVTREYQICLKCHSNYAYSDDNVYPNSTNRPQLGGTGRTAQNANGHSSFTSYTNQAKEFQAPLSHAVAVGGANLGNDGGTGTAASNNNNHRSWHPVMAPTGRTGRAGSWIAPWNESGTGNKAGRLGVQTMYCSDCHGSSTGTAASVIPTGGENSAPWGPHGSSVNFLLKGDYSTATGTGQTTALCFKCHSVGAYGDGGGGTGWQIERSPANGSNNLGDGHKYHLSKLKVNGNGDNALRCNWCHVAVPHGWKNRNFLVNLLDVGAEAGQPAGTPVTYTKNQGYTNGPYYRRAYLRVISFPASGTRWTPLNCNGGTSGNAGMLATCDAPN